MKREAIILAGGLGTRLSKIVTDVPKPMAPVGGRPFIEHLLGYLRRNDVENVVLSVGYRSEIIRHHLGSLFEGVNLAYVTERVPLGTGGAVKKAMEVCEGDSILIANGDTFFDVNLDEFYTSHFKTDADFSLALKKLHKPDRFGTVCIDNSGKVIDFREKEVGLEEGLVNGGLYLVNSSMFNSFEMPEKFSLENDFLTEKCKEIQINGYSSDAYFVDIGIPDDYYKADEYFRLLSY